MKYLAHLENNLESEIISIYDVIKSLNGNNPVDWEERIYYSLWRSIPMKAVVNVKKKKPHFAFASRYGGNQDSGGGESIEHQLSKKIIFDLKTLKIKIGEIEGVLNFSEVIIEQPFENGNYKADLYAKISNENNFNFPVNSMIIIEIHKTNRVKKSKEKFYRNNNLTAIEIELYKKIKFEGDIEKLQNQLNGYYEKPRFAKRLHDPNWKDIVFKREEKKKHEEQQRLQQQNDELAKREKIRNEQIKSEKLQRHLTKQQEPKIAQSKIEIAENKKPKKKSFIKKILDCLIK